MSVVTVDLPDPLRAYAEERAARGGYRDVAAFVRALLKSDQVQHHRDRLEAMLLEAVDGPFTPWTPADLDEVRRRRAAAIAPAHPSVE